MLAVGSSELPNSRLMAAKLLCRDPSAGLVVLTGQVKEAGRQWVVYFSGLAAEQVGEVLRLQFQSDTGEVLIKVPVKVSQSGADPGDPVVFPAGTLTITYPLDGTEENPRLVSAASFVAWGTITPASSTGSGVLEGWSYNGPSYSITGNTWYLTFTSVTDNDQPTAMLEVMIGGESDFVEYLSLDLGPPSFAPADPGPWGEDQLS